jgi:hypothetical protein
MRLVRNDKGVALGWLVIAPFGAKSNQRNTKTRQRGTLAEASA